MNKSALTNSFIPASFWRVALYIRLSKEDYALSPGKDSGSVQNQLIILRKYAKENGMFIVDEYVDDGYSGTNFDRPGFQRMLNAIRKKEVNCVITKDLSRLGRNHLEVGYYIETFFPENRIRYIAVNESYDSLNGDSDIVPFMNIINEMVAKQTSKKNRQVFESKFSDGGMHSRHITYGYLKDPQDKNHRLVDSETVGVVHAIFDMAELGNGALKIQKWLYNNKVECPSYRIYKQTGMYADLFEGQPEERRYKWNVSMIRRMLSDMTYLGHSIHYKKRTISYKNKKQISYPQDQWVVIENTHEPIIDQEQFDAVQKVIGVRKRSKKKDGNPGLFTGLLRCSGCGNSMSRYDRVRKTMDSSHYVCAKNSQGTTFTKCSPHYIREDILSETILERIQQLFAETKVNKTLLIKKIEKASGCDANTLQTKWREESESLEKRLGVLSKLLSKLYEDWASDSVSEDNFALLSRKYQEEQTTCLQRLKEIRTQLASIDNNGQSAKRFVDIVDSLSCPTELTRELLFSMIEKIVVHEANKKDSGFRNEDQKIDIYWKYVGQV